ncbi:TIGR02281 family clan AA aspartic protease [Ferrimonas sediminicola]|uniref:TIGR02281 family clan AA aspartic protease n=1 Tax=Ferrimonas sediminicola TaxID=2569538 RepID=A0A4U1BIT3_9GAMM|nr:retropepsin-like aspartic protease [Ferrimonas sediminicola]TKB51289.1 TIGR02281 family clan AA aspartic protease [Ferrimonas sediminicola]
MKRSRPHSPFGKPMLFLAWLSMLALLYLYFDDKLERQHNPNLNPMIQGQELVLQQNRQGHYLVVGTINGQEVTLMLDTGATTTSIPAHLGPALGLKAGYPFPVSTANGSITVYRTTVETLTIGPLTLYNLEASLNPGQEDDTVLLGMNALRHLELVQRGQTLTIRK